MDVKASISKHNQQFKHNKDFLESFHAKDFPDWKITCCYYSALHKAHVYMLYVHSIDESNINTHQSMICQLKKKNKKIGNKYGQLCNLCRMARYNCIDMSERTSEAINLYNDIVQMCDTDIKAKASAALT